MAFAISVQDSVADTVRLLDDIQRQQIPFATARALTRTAQLVKSAEVHEMGDVFDRPTPYTLDSLFVRSATKATLSANVWLKSDTSKGTPADKYLLPQIRGGGRGMKRMEKALQSVGALPPGYYVVPGEAAKLDSYGNVDRGLIVQILSYFKAFPEAGYRANITDKRKQRLARGTKSKVGYAFFVGRPGGGKAPLGVWQRFNLAHGSAVKPVLIFVPGVRFSAIYDFKFVADQTVARVFPSEFRVSLLDALATARPRQ